MADTPVTLLRAHARHSPWNARGLAAHVTALVDSAGLRPTNASARAAPGGAGAVVPALPPASREPIAVIPTERDRDCWCAERQVRVVESDSRGAPMGRALRSDGSPED